MSEVKWTPEPLDVDEDYRPGMAWNRHLVLARDHNMRIAFMANFTPHHDAAERWANLLAAAPELYEALAEMLSLWEGFSKDELKRRHLLGFIDTPALERIFAGRAVLAKARGEGTAP